MCSRRRELAHIKPHRYGEGCDHQLTERNKWSKRTEEEGEEMEERSRKRLGGSSLARELLPFLPKIKHPNKC